MFEMSLQRVFFSITNKSKIIVMLIKNKLIIVNKKLPACVSEIQIWVSEIEIMY